MKAVVLTAYGDIDRLELRELPDPRADAGTLVVRVAGASINPIDWKIRNGSAKGRIPLTLPAVLGRDASGEVVEVGAGVTSFAKGDRVLGLVFGSYGELVKAPLDAWARLPPGLDVVEAGALPLVLLTGAQLIEQAAQPASGSTILVTGALGSVGRVAVYAAKERGAKVWAGVRARARDEASKLGAAGVVALDDEADVERMPMVDAVADTVGGETTQRLLRKLKPGGAVGSVVGEPAGAKDKGFAVRAFMARPDPAMLARYAQAVADGKFAVPIAKKVPLARAAEAQRFAETQHPAGKVLLVG